MGASSNHCRGARDLGGGGGGGASGFILFHTILSFMFFFCETYSGGTVLCPSLLVAKSDPMQWFEDAGRDR